MFLSGISSASSTAALLQMFQQRNQDLASLELAVQSGNAVAAQQSRAALQQDAQTIQSALDQSSNQSAGGQGAGSSSRQPAGSSAQSAFASNFTALLQAA